MERLVFLKKSYVVVKELDQKPLYIRAKIDVDYRLAGPDDFDTLEGHMLPWKYYRKVYDERLERGLICMIGFVGPQAVGYIWPTSSPEKDRNLGFTITPGADEIYCLDLYVLPEYRKYLVGYELLSLLLKDAYEAGRKRAIGVVEEWNTPMMMTTKLVFGFRKAKTLYSVTCFRKRGFLIHTADGTARPAKKKVADEARGNQ